MSLIISNLADGTTQTVANGALGFLTLHASPPGTTAANSGRGLFVQSDASEWQFKRLTTGDVVWTYSRGLGGTGASGMGIGGTGAAYVAGDLVSVTQYQPIQENDVWSGGDGEFLHSTPAASIFLTATTPGIFYVTLSLEGITAAQYCGLLVTVLPYFNLPLYPALSWVPSDLIDLQVDVGARLVNSAVLSHCLGLKQGDDFILAVVPKLAGTLITSGITAMSLSIIDRVNSPYTPISFAATGSPPTLTEVGGDPTHQYYSIVGNLRDAQIAAWFGDLNKRIDALAAAATPNSTTPLPCRSRLEALAQLHITDADGIVTTQNFPFPILAAAEVLTSVGAATTTADSGIDLQWDLATNTVSALPLPSAIAPSAIPAAEAPLIFLKEQDDLIARLRLVKNGSALAPTVTACKLVLKELEPENQIVISDAFATSGTGDNFSLLIHAKFNGATLAGALSNYEADTGTTFSALAEFELTYTNPWYGTVGPSSLVRTSKTFRIQIDRDLGEAA